MLKNTLFESNVSLDSYKSINEYDERVDSQENLISNRLTAYIPIYNQSIAPHKIKGNLSKTPDKPKKNSNKSMDQRHFKITLEKPKHKIMGDLDNLLSCSNISDIYLKSSGILAKTLCKSKCLNFSPFGGELAKINEYEFCDVESKYNTNSIYLENSFFKEKELAEINTISSILIKNNKESHDFPRKHFNLRKKNFKIAGKELAIPYDFVEIPNKNLGSEKISEVNIEEILENSYKFINSNELDKILDYFDITPLPREKPSISSIFNKNLNETIHSMMIDPQVPEDEQLYEILNESDEKSFELPVISCVIQTENNNSTAPNSSNFLEIDIKRIEIDEFERNSQLISPKFPNLNISDSLEIENIIINQNSLIEDNNNLYFSFAELIKQENHQKSTNFKDFFKNSETLEKFGKNEKNENFSQFFIQEKASFQSFYQSAIKKKCENSSVMINNKKKNLLTERKENKILERNEFSYIQKIISSTNNKKNTVNLKKNKENKPNIVKSKNQLNFKKNQEKTKLEEVR